MKNTDSQFESEQEKLNAFFQSREESLSADHDRERSEALLRRARHHHSARSAISLAIGRLGAGLMGFVHTIILLLTHGSGPHSERIRLRVERAASESQSESLSDS